MTRVSSQASEADFETVGEISVDCPLYSGMQDLGSGDSFPCRGSKISGGAPLRFIRAVPGPRGFHQQLMQIYPDPNLTKTIPS